MTLGIILIILGALPVLYGAWRMFVTDPGAFIFAILVTVGVIGCIALIVYGASLVSR